jgi:hypothetical protein
MMASGKGAIAASFLQARDDMEQITHKTMMIASLVLVLAIGGVQVSAAAVTVTIDDYTSATGGEVTVPLMINGVKDYGVGTINITYDPAVVHVAGVSDGDDSTVTASNSNNTAGITSIGAWNIGGVSGDIVFANVALKAVGSSGESSPLSLTVAKLVDTSMDAIPAGQSGGVFVISGSSGDAAYTPTPTPTPASGSTGQPSSQLTPPLPRVVGEPADPGAEDSPESPPSQPSSPAEDADVAGTTDTGDDTEPHGVQTPSQKAPGSGVVSISLSILLVYLILTRNAKRGGGR